MAEFLEKYSSFKIYDEKGKVYPLHIGRSINQEYHEPETFEDEPLEKLEATEDFKQFFELINKSSDVVLPSIEHQELNQEVREQEIAPLVS